MTAPDCAVISNLINIYTYIDGGKYENYYTVYCITRRYQHIVIKYCTASSNSSINILLNNVQPVV